MVLYVSKILRDTIHQVSQDRLSKEVISGICQEQRKGSKQHKLLAMS